MNRIWRFFAGDDTEAKEREHDLRVDATIRAACGNVAIRLEEWDHPLAPAARAFLEELSRANVTRGELDRAATEILRVVL